MLILSVFGVQEGSPMPPSAPRRLPDDFCILCLIFFVCLFFQCLWLSSVVKAYVCFSAVSASVCFSAVSALFIASIHCTFLCYVCAHIHDQTLARMYMYLCMRKLIYVQHLRRQRSPSYYLRRPRGPVLYAVLGDWVPRPVET